MKIALFYPDTQFTSWSMSQGIASTLSRLGHSVVAGKLPTGDTGITDAYLEAMKASMPTLEVLAAVDLVLVSGPELIVPWLEVIYGKYEWKHSIKAPKIAWYHSPFFNDGVTINFDHLSYYADEHFFPAIQDAEFFDQEGMAKDRASWLPFGVDVDMFPCYEKRGPHDHPIAHVGIPGDKAQRYMEALGQHEFPPVRVGDVVVRDLEGIDAYETARRLWKNLVEIKVFLNFPGPNFVEAKLFEVMACGTFVLTPLLTSSSGISKNQALFENGIHWLCYRAANVPHVAKMLREWSSDEKAEEREKIAQSGSAEVHKNHSLEKRLETIFAKVGLREVVQ